MECNQIHIFYQKQECEKDNEDEDIWRVQSQLDDSFQEQRVLDKSNFFDGNNEVVRILNQKMCYKF